MGARREYQAIFSIGARLQASFGGVMTAAQARLRGLQRTAVAVAGRMHAMALSIGASLRRVAMGVLALGGVFAGFAIGKIFKDIFTGAAQEAQDAHQRVRALTTAFMRLDAIRRSADPAKKAAQQVALLQKEVKLMSEESVIHEDIYELMGARLARYAVPPQQIANSIRLLGDLLVEQQGVNATEEQGAELAKSFGLAVSSGNLRAVKTTGILTKEQAKVFAKLTTPAARFDSLFKALQRYAGTAARAFKTPEGRIVALQNYVKSLRHELGEQLLPVQAEMADAWLKALPELKPVMIWAFKGLLSVAIALARFVTGTLIPAMKSLHAWWERGGNRLTSLIKHLAMAIGAVAAALVAVSVISSPFALIAAGVLLLTGLVLALTIDFKDLQAAINALPAEFPLRSSLVSLALQWEHFRIGFAEGWKLLKAIVSGFWDGLVEGYNNLVNAVNIGAQAIMDAMKSIGRAIKDFFLAPIYEVKAGWQSVVNLWSQRPAWLGGGGGAPAAPSPAAPAADTANIPEFQGGGIIQRSMLARVGEHGPEAIIPLSGGMRALGLLNYAAQRLGVLGGFSRGGPTTVTFAPTVHISGNATESEQRAMDSRLRDLCADFIKQFKAAQAHERRLSYESGYG